MGSGTTFYFDYQNSQYGYNTSSARGADTFHPFKSGGSPNYRITITYSVYYSGMNLGSTVTTTYDLIDGVITNRQGAQWAYYKSGAYDFRAVIESVTVTPLDTESNPVAPIYNAIVGQGVTPASSSVNDIVSCISNGDLDVKHNVRVFVQNGSDNDDWLYIYTKMVNLFTIVDGFM